MPNVKVWMLKNTKFSVSYLTLWIMFASKQYFCKKEKKNSIDSVNKKVKQQMGALNPSFRLPVPPLMLYRFMEFDILPSTLLRTLLICLVKHLPKYISLPLIPEDWREGLVRFEEKNVFIGFQKSNLIVLLIFSLLLLQYEIYSVCNAIVIIFLIEKHFFKINFM